MGGMARRAAHPWLGRWGLPWLLALPVAAGHLILATLWPEDRFGFGEGAAPPARMAVAFVRELQPALAPPAPAAAPPTRVLRAAAPRAAASAALAAEIEREPLSIDPALREVAAAPDLPPLLTQAPLPDLVPAPSVASAPSTAGAASAPAAATFEWPPSTRLSYQLTGNYRGPVEGQARVEWRLVGTRYQVALDVTIGPSFAPLVSRQLQSDGVVGDNGLEPRRYDEETHIVLRAPRRLSIVMEADRVRLPSGRELARPPGLQDSASQFVQMTWLFTTQPERLVPGHKVQMPLALPRHVEVWSYEVVGPVRLETPVGPLETQHVRPQRPPREGASGGGSGGGGGDLAAEFWVAPALQYLPVRILIRQDEETYVDLLLSRLPQQAEVPRR